MGVSRALTTPGGAQRSPNIEARDGDLRGEELRGEEVRGQDSEAEIPETRTPKTAKSAATPREDRRGEESKTPRRRERHSATGYPARACQCQTPRAGLSRRPAVIQRGSSIAGGPEDPRTAKQFPRLQRAPRAPHRGDSEGRSCNAIQRQGRRTELVNA